MQERIERIDRNEGHVSMGKCIGAARVFERGCSSSKGVLRSRARCAGLRSGVLENPLATPPGVPYI